jgi:uncharacterized membrane protein
MWLSLVERSVRDREVVGSNPAIPTRTHIAAGPRACRSGFVAEAAVYTTLLQWFGYGLCHQLPERSFFGGGVQVPVCARDTGIYVGFVVSMLVIAAVQRNRPTGFPSAAVAALMAAFVLVMALDGVTSYAGLRVTSNVVRLVSGLMAGYAMGALSTVLLNDVLWRDGSPDRVLGTGRALALWLLSIAATFAAVWWIAPLAGAVYPLLVVVCILATLTSVNAIIVCSLRAFERRAARLRDAWLPLLLAFGLSWVEVALSALIKLWLVGISGG